MALRDVGCILDSVCWGVKHLSRTLDAIAASVQNATSIMGDLWVSICSSGNTSVVQVGLKSFTGSQKFFLYILVVFKYCIIYILIDLPILNKHCWGAK